MFLRKSIRKIPILVGLLGLSFFTNRFEVSTAGTSASDTQELPNAPRSEPLFFDDVAFGFKKVDSFGKCSRISIAKMDELAGKALPFAVFANTVGDDGALKECLDGSGEAKSVETFGSFDKVLGLNLAIEYFVNQGKKEPVVRYAVSAAARTTSLDSVSSIWKNPGAAAPTGYEQFVYNNPSDGRIFTRSSAYFAMADAAGAAIDSDFTSDNWIKLDPVVDKIKTSSNPDVFIPLVGKSPWMEIFSIGRLLSGMPLIFNDKVLAIGAFNDTGSHFKSNSIFKFNKTATKFSKGLEYKLANDWLFVQYDLAARTIFGPANYVTKISASNSDVIRSLLLGSWSDPAITAEDSKLLSNDAQNASIISASRVQGGLCVLSSSGVSLLLGKKLEDFSTTVLGIRSSKQMPLLTKEQSKSYTKIAASLVGSGPSAAIYLAGLKIVNSLDRVVELWKFSGENFQTSKSLIIPALASDVALDDDGNLAVVGANKILYWKKAEELIASADTINALLEKYGAIINLDQELYAFREYMLLKTTTSYSQIMDLYAKVNLVQAKIAPAAEALANTTNDADWVTAWNYYLTQEAAFLNYVAALECALLDYNETIEYLLNLNPYDDSLRSKIELILPVQEDIDIKRDAVLNSIFKRGAGSLFDNYDLFLKMKMERVAAIQSDSTTLNDFQLKIVEFTNFVSQMIAHKNSFYERLSRFVVLANRRKQSFDAYKEALVKKPSPADADRPAQQKIVGYVDGALSRAAKTLETIDAFYTLKPQLIDNIATVSDKFQALISAYYGTQDSHFDKNLALVLAASDKSSLLDGLNLLAKKVLALLSSAERFYSQTNDNLTNQKMVYDARVRDDSATASMQTIDNDYFSNKLVTIKAAFDDYLALNPNDFSKNIPAKRNKIVDDLTGISKKLNEELVAASGQLEEILKSNLQDADAVANAKSLKEKIKLLGDVLSGWKNLSGFGDVLNKKMQEQYAALSDIQTKLAGVSADCLAGLQSSMAALKAKMSTNDFSAATSVQDLLDKVNIVVAIKDDIIAKLGDVVSQQSEEIKRLNGLNDGLKADLIALRESIKSALTLLLGTVDINKLPADVKATIISAKASGTQDALIGAAKSIMSSQALSIDQLQQDNAYYKDLAQRNASTAVETAQLAEKARQKLVSDMATQATDFNNELARLREKHAQELSDLSEADAKATALEIARIEASHAAKMNDLQQAKNESDAYNQQLLKDLGESEAKRTTLMQQKAQLEADLKSAQTDNARKDELLKQQAEVDRQLNEALEYERKVSKDRAENLEIAQTTIRKQEKDLLELSDKYKDSVAASKALSGQLEAVIAAKDRADKAAKQALTNLRNINDILSSTVEDLQKQVEVFTDIIDKNIDLKQYADVGDTPQELVERFKLPAAILDQKSALDAMTTDALVAALNNLGVDAGVYASFAAKYELQRQKNSLLSLLDIDEKNLFNVMVNGGQFTSDQLNPFTMDWLLTSYLEVVSMQSMQAAYLKDVAIDIDLAFPVSPNADGTVPAKKSVTLGLVPELLTSLPDALQPLVKILKAYQYLTDAAVSADKVKTAENSFNACLQSIYSQMSETKKDVIAQVVDANTQASLMASSSRQLFKAAIATNLMAQIDPYKDAVLAWDLLSAPKAMLESVSKIESEGKARFIAQVTKDVDATSSRSLSWYKNEIYNITTKDKTKLQASVSKMSLNILIKKTNAEKMVRDQSNRAALSSLQVQAAAQAADYRLELAKGEKTIAEAKQAMEVAKKQYADELNAQKNKASSIAATYASSTQALAASNYATSRVRVKNQLEQQILDYGDSRAKLLSGKGAIVQSSDTTKFQILADEGVRVSRWAPYAKFILPVGGAAFDAQGASRMLEIDLDDSNNIIARNKNQIGSFDEVLFGFSPSLSAPKIYLDGKFFAQGMLPKANRFDAILSTNDTKLLAVNESDNLTSFKITTKSADGALSNFVVILKPVQRVVDLVSGFGNGQEPDVVAAREAAKQLQANVAATLSARKNYEVMVVPEGTLIVEDGMGITLKIKNDNPSVPDSFLGVYSNKRQGLTGLYPVESIIASISHDNVHFSLEKNGTSYRMISSDKKYKLASYLNKLVCIDKDAVSIDQSSGLTLTAKEKATNPNGNYVNVNDSFSFSGSSKDVVIMDSAGQTLSFDGSGQAIMSATKNGTPIELIADEQLFYLEGASDPVDESAVIIRTYSSVAGNNLHGYLTVLPGENGKMNLSYLPWVSADYHRRPGLRESMFSVHRYTIQGSEEYILADFLKNLSSKDDQAVIDSARGYTARDQYFEDVLQVIKSILPAAAQDLFWFEDMILSLNDTVAYKMNSGMMSAKDAWIIKSFAKDQVATLASAVNLRGGSFAQIALQGKDGKGGLTNLSDKTSSINISDGDIVNLRLKENFVGWSKDGVSLSQGNSTATNFIFVASGSAQAGFVLKTFDGSQKLALKEDGSLIISATADQASDKFVFEGNSIDAAFVKNGTQYLSLVETKDAGNNVVDRKVVGGADKSAFVLEVSKKGRFDGDLFNYDVSPVSGSLSFKDFIMNALKQDQSAMHKNLRRAIAFLEVRVTPQKKDWFDEIQRLVYDANGLLGDAVTKNIDADLVKKLADLVKIFEALPTDYFMISNEDGELLSTFGPLDSTQMISVKNASAARKILPLHFIKSNSELSRACIFRFVPIVGVQGRYALVGYSSQIKEPFYITASEPVDVKSDKGSFGYSLMLGSACLIDNKDSIVTDRPSEMFDVRGNMSQISLRSISSTFGGGKGFAAQVSFGDDKIFALSSPEATDGFVDESTVSKDQRKFDPVLKLRKLDSMEKDLYMAESIEKIPVALYMNLFTIANDKTLSDEVRTARADSVINIFKNFATNVDEKGNLAFKNSLILRNFDRIKTDDNKGVYSLYDILSLVNERISYYALVGAGIKWSNEARISLAKMIAIAKEAKEYAEKLANPAMARTNLNSNVAQQFMAKINKNNKGFVFNISEFIMKANDAGLKEYMNDILSFLFDTRFVIPDSYVIQPASYMVRNDFTMGLTTNFVDQLRQLFISAFAVEPEHPFKNLVTQLIAKLEAGSGNAATVVKTSYSQFEVYDRLSVAERMIKGGRYKNLSGKVVNGINRAEATSILQSITDAELNDTDSPADYRKWRDDLNRLITNSSSSSTQTTQSAADQTVVANPTQAFGSFGLGGL